jgi:eukaryotic-like serine/threonine-protein kinase
MIGRTLSHYTIESRLGKGGMGEVYQARDGKLGRAVAIKVLPETSAASSENVRRFVTEARAASSLNHPNIVTVHDIDQEGSTHYIVMEKIDGEPLSGVLGEPMKVERFIDVALQITSAIAAAHEAGIVHRDLKPANVMITQSGVVKVVDFGLARLAPMEASGGEDPTIEWTGSHTRPGTVLGTVGYMAPEQVEGQRADARSDVFSLGVLFYELLSGKSAFRTSTPISTFAAILRDTPPPLQSLRADIPQDLQRILDRCLAKKPEERYPGASALHEDLLSLRRTVTQRASPPASRHNVRWIVVAAVVLALLAGAFIAARWRQESRVRWARDVAPAEVERLLEADDAVGAYVVARRAMEIAPDDAQVLQAWVNLTTPVTITSDPPGAHIAIRSYRAAQDDPWIALGETPISSVHVPFPLIRYRVSKEGYSTLETAPEFDLPEIEFRLHRPADTPEGMVAVQGGETSFGGTTATVPDFWIGVFEVTNADYKKFVDGGGYRRPELWKHPFARNGETLSWEAAMEMFVDQTGRPGPSGWELGSFAEGKGRHPVEGVSWFEAAAYAEFAGKSLPTVFHWKRAAANDGIFSDILLRSNFDGKGTVATGERDGLGHWGTYDMAGNVKEWCLNAVDEKRYTLGGSWLDASYFYSEPDARDPFVRDPGFGLRLMEASASISPDLLAHVRTARYEIPPPVDDATFKVFASLFDYDAAPLNQKTEEIDDSHDAWRRERVSFDAVYGGERVTAHLFIPKNARPPYQTIVYFPGSDATLMKSSRNLWLRMVEFYIRSGRVLVFPIYKGTYERQVPPPRGHNDFRELNAQRVKDIRRTLDYLETRNDIDQQRIGYYGLSLGASRGAFLLAVEPRFRMAVLFGTGFYPVHFSGERPGDLQPHNYLPRIDVPTLLINGRHDFTLPLELAQKPFYELIGSGEGRKKLVLFEGGHVPGQFNDAVKEMLSWTDQWMGPVQLQ